MRRSLAPRATVAAQRFLAIVIRRTATGPSELEWVRLIRSFLEFDSLDSLNLQPIVVQLRRIGAVDQHQHAMQRRSRANETHQLVSLRKLDAPRV